MSLLTDTRFQHIKLQILDRVREELREIWPNSYRMLLLEVCAIACGINIFVSHLQGKVIHCIKYAASYEIDALIRRVVSTFGKVLYMFENNMTELYHQKLIRAELRRNHSARFDLMEYTGQVRDGFCSEVRQLYPFVHEWCSVTVKRRSIYEPYKRRIQIGDVKFYHQPHITRMLNEYLADFERQRELKIAQLRILHLPIRQAIEYHW